jgi:germination protein M
MRRTFATLGVLALLAAGTLLAGCGSADTSTPTTLPTTTEPPPTTTAPPTTTVATTTSLSVYFLRDGKIAASTREVPETQAVATAALTALIAGPDSTETSAGLSTALSASQTFSDLTISGGVAKLTLPGDLTEEAQAQVVYTLTQFSTVGAVELDGKRLMRKSFEDVTPAILIESPVPGDEISPPLHIRGTANTFEATFQVKLDISGRKAFEQTVTATSGSGTRGTFDVSIPFGPGGGGPATLTAYEDSAENGQPIHVVQIPVVVR